jgi:cytidine deaminase
MLDDSRIAALFDAAKRARARAYAPYSDFAVGAAALDETGAIHAGCNVENAAHPAGACAETGAISAMVAGGGTRLLAILVMGAGDALCTPCGACRQRIREFADEGAAVLVAGPEGLRRSFTLGELLPESFGPGNIDLPRPSQALR